MITLSATYEYTSETNIIDSLSRHNWGFILSAVINILGVLLSIMYYECMIHQFSLILVLILLDGWEIEKQI